MSAIVERTKTFKPPGLDGPNTIGDRRFCLHVSPKNNHGIQWDAIIQNDAIAKGNPTFILLQFDPIA